MTQPDPATAPTTLALEGGTRNRAARVADDLADYRGEPIPGAYVRAVAIDMAAEVIRLCDIVAQLGSQLAQAQADATERRTLKETTATRERQGAGVAAADDKPRLTQPKVSV